MTPKEKAIELVDKCSIKVSVYFTEDSILRIVNANLRIESAKQFALIAVDEIIKSKPIVPLEFMLESEALDAANEYWQEVRQEIENYDTKRKSRSRKNSSHSKTKFKKTNKTSTRI